MSWKNIIKPPFRYDSEGGYIFDGDNNPVLEVRGYGALLSGIGGVVEAGVEQDAFAEWVASVLSEALKEK